MKYIVPALLTDNLADFKDQVRQLEGLVELVQVDIIDGKFADNKTITIEDVEKFDLPFNVEFDLMVINPSSYFEKCDRANAQRVFFHIEASNDPAKDIELLSKRGIEAGLSINPDTSVTALEPYLDSISRVLIMSVTPGFQGQQFIPETLERIQLIKRLAPEMTVAVDGGIKLHNVSDVAAAGADYLSVGSALFEEDDLVVTLQKFREKINFQ